MTRGYLRYWSVCSLPLEQAQLIQKIQHGEINCLQEFYKLDPATRPDVKDCIFFATHEPCSLCESGSERLM